MLWTHAVWTCNDSHLRFVCWIFWVLESLLLKTWTQRDSLFPWKQMMLAIQRCKHYWEEDWAYSSVIERHSPSSQGFAWTFLLMILQTPKQSTLIFQVFAVKQKHWNTPGLPYLLIELMLGTLLGSHTCSSTSLSRISQANIVGLLCFSCRIFCTTVGVATLGLEPPISPGLMLPVSLYLAWLRVVCGEERLTLTHTRINRQPVGCQLLLCVVSVCMVGMKLACHNIWFWISRFFLLC